ncbi:MAG TPA: DUF6325 family protein [Ornithinibacter sp.]|nr:DUF6325 family protein [Ornithinibacter sp.]
MTTTTDALGPIDFLLMEFPNERTDGAAAAALADLIEAGTIRLLDLVIARKEVDGTVEVIDIDGLGDVSSFVQFAGARSGLIGHDDVQQAGEAMTPGTTAALLVFENAWAAPFVAAARKNGGEVIASMRIPAQDVMDALDALETEEE